jgi:hypothetical protein
MNGSILLWSLRALRSISSSRPTKNPTSRADNRRWRKRAMKMAGKTIAKLRRRS